MKKRRRLGQCPNCQTQLNITDNFCPNCGQENHARTFSLRELWEDFIGSFFNFDGKIFTTFKMIFLRPGKVPKDILNGKKVRYVPTIRFYFFVSFIYFLILNFGVDLMMQSSESKKLITEITQINNEHKLPIDDSTFHLYKDSSEVALNKLALHITDTIQKATIDKNKFILWNEINAIDSIYLRKYEDSQRVGSSIKINAGGISYNVDDMKTFSPTQIVYKINSTYDSVMIYGYRISKENLKMLHKDRDSIGNFAEVLNPDLGYIDRAFLQTQIEASAVYRFGTLTEIKNFVTSFFKKNLSNFSLALLIIMPLSAMILYLFYMAKHPKVVPHIIFTIHLHTVMLILLSILFAIITGQFVVNFILNDTIWNFIILFLLIYSSLYFVYALKRFYATTWLTAFYKSTIIGSIYTVLLLAIAIVVFVISMF